MFNIYILQQNKYYMKKQIFSLLFVCFNLLFAFAQQTVVQGVVKDMLTDQPISGVMVSIEGTQLFTYTDELGTFELGNLKIEIHSLEEYQESLIFI